jgi:hypothetical protein
MLVIRAEQLRVLGELVRAQFVARLAAHVRQQRPDACAKLSEGDLEALVAQGVERAASFGFTAESDASRFVLTLFTIGMDFPSDPRHGWARSILDPHSGRLSSFRSEQLLEEATAWANDQLEVAPAATEGA